MRQLIYDPKKQGMKIACFVSGSGTNYEKIFRRDQTKKYFLFTNRPECGGIRIAPENKIPPLILDSDHYFGEMLRSEKTARKGMERDSYDMAACTLIEQTINGKPDLICLAGYDLWVGDWMVNRYYPTILNVHPGDTTKGYKGLGWIPSALAILSGENQVRSTVFFVDRGDDTGPVLVQSKPVHVSQKEWESELFEIRDFAEKHNTKTIKNFETAAKNEGKAFLSGNLKNISAKLQEILKQQGDWIIYPFAVHDLIAKGMVELDGRTVYIDSRKMPEHGYRIDEHDSKGE
jgi:phosphoribosylglycinamide formyltransferase-1